MQCSGSLMFKLQIKPAHMIKQVQNLCLHHKKSHGIDWKVLSEDLASLGQRVYNIEIGNCLSSIYYYSATKFKERFSLLEIKNEKTMDTIRELPFSLALCKNLEDKIKE